MIYDPYKAYKAGRISAELLAARYALDEAFVAAVSLVPGSDYSEGIVGALGKAQDAVREAASIELWELARPETVGPGKERPTDG